MAWPTRTLCDLELAVGLLRADDQVIGAAIVALGVGFRLIIRRCHHIEERLDRWIIDQRDVIPVGSLGLAEHNPFRIAGPKQRAAAGLDHRHGVLAIALVGIPARAIAV